MLRSFVQGDEAIKMKWLEKLFGPANYRQYGENEFYEYSRNRSSEPSRSDRDSGWHSTGASSSYGGWRGPSIFEVGYLTNKFFLKCWLLWYINLGFSPFLTSFEI